jgi:carbon storage regulator CsrA
MLVLTRKARETIHIGDRITIRVVRIQGNTVRVGIEAPDDVRVMRGEVVARPQGEPPSETPPPAASAEQLEDAGDAREADGQTAHDRGSARYQYSAGNNVPLRASRLRRRSRPQVSTPIPPEAATSSPGCCSPPA